MRVFRALCATLGALLIVSTLPSGAYATDGPTLSETFVLTKDCQLDVVRELLVLIVRIVRLVG